MPIYGLLYNLRSPAYWDAGGDVVEQMIGSYDYEYGSDASEEIPPTRRRQ